ncbi:MAG TPA: PIN domain-containing protein [Candidatus Tectomicrobia bacterium]
MIRTFVDSGVLISAATGRDALFDKALDILDDPERVLITSDFVRLEVLPKAMYFQRQDEVEFYETFFASVEQTVHISEALIAQAHIEAQNAGLGALDALHVAAAKASAAEELVTTERPTTALFRVAGITVTTIRPVERV